MNKSYYILILSFVFLLSSCEVIGGIFKAGFFSAIIVGVLLIALVIWIVSRFRRQG